EVGHVLGLEHPDAEGNAHDLMADALPPGVRRLPAGQESARDSVESPTGLAEVAVLPPPGPSGSSPADERGLTGTSIVVARPLLRPAPGPARRPAGGLSPLTARSDAAFAAFAWAVPLAHPPAPLPGSFPDESVLVAEMARHAQTTPALS